ncbi:MAG: AraC family transcriptional regulator [Cyanobacteria bacterium P01_G01_bin.49]
MKKHDKIISILPRLPIVSSINCGGETLQLACCREPAFSIPEHKANYHGICINGGKVVQLMQKIDGKIKIVNSVPGNVGIYPAYLHQSFAWDKEAEFWLIYLEPKLISNLGYELYQTDNVELIPQLNSLFDPLIKQIALALKTNLETDNFGSRLYTDSMANALAVHLLSRYSNCSRQIRANKGKLSQQQLSQVIDYINSNLDQKITLAQLAKVVQLSEFHFGRLFEQTTDTSPHQYHLQCRVERAKSLLLQGIAIAQVAQTVGFSSQGHLNYHFKRLVGVTPKKFLKQ